MTGHATIEPRASRRDADAAIVADAWRLEDEAEALLPALVAAPTRLKQGRAVRAEALRAAAAGHPEAAALLRKADARFWELAYRHKGLGFKVAQRVVPHHEVHDRGRWAMIGLFRAAVRFEPARGLAFTTYAEWWVRAVLVRNLIEQGRDVEVPNGAQRSLCELKRIDRETPGLPDDEVAELLGCSVSRLHELRNVGAAVAPAARLDAPVSADNTTTLGELLADDGAPTPEDETSRTVDRARLRRALATLPAREQRVLTLRYGLDGDEPMTLAETGKAESGTCRERARQLEQKAFAALRLVLAPPPADAEQEPVAVVVEPKRRGPKPKPKPMPAPTGRNVWKAKPPCAPSPEEAPMHPPAQSPAPTVEQARSTVGVGGSVEPITPENPMTASPAASSSPSLSSSVVSPVGDDKGGGASSRLCAWPGCTTPRHGRWCKTHQWRVRVAMGLDPATTDPAEAARLWAARHPGSAPAGGRKRAPAPHVNRSVIAKTCAWQGCGQHVQAYGLCARDYERVYTSLGYAKGKPVNMAEAAERWEIRRGRKVASASASVSPPVAVQVEDVRARLAEVLGAPAADLDDPVAVACNVIRTLRADLAAVTQDRDSRIAGLEGKIRGLEFRALDRSNPDADARVLVLDTKARHLERDLAAVTQDRDDLLLANEQLTREEEEQRARLNAVNDALDESKVDPDDQCDTEADAVRLLAGQASGARAWIEASNAQRARAVAAEGELALLRGGIAGLMGYTDGAGDTPTSELYAELVRRFDGAAVRLDEQDLRRRADLLRQADELRARALS